MAILKQSPTAFAKYLVWYGSCDEVNQSTAQYEFLEVKTNFDIRVFEKSLSISNVPEILQIIEYTQSGTGVRIFDKNSNIKFWDFTSLRVGHLYQITLSKGNSQIELPNLHFYNDSNQVGYVTSNCFIEPTPTPEQTPTPTPEQTPTPTPEQTPTPTPKQTPTPTPNQTPTPTPDKTPTPTPEQTPTPTPEKTPTPTPEQTPTPTPEQTPTPTPEQTPTPTPEKTPTPTPEQTPTPTPEKTPTPTPEQTPTSTPEKTPTPTPEQTPTPTPEQTPTPTPEKTPTPTPERTPTPTPEKTPTPTPFNCCTNTSLKVNEDMSGVSFQHENSDNLGGSICFESLTSENISTDSILYYCFDSQNNYICTINISSANGIEDYAGDSTSAFGVFYYVTSDGNCLRGDLSTGTPFDYANPVIFE